MIHNFARLPRERKDKRKIVVSEQQQCPNQYERYRQVISRNFSEHECESPEET